MSYKDWLKFMLQPTNEADVAVAKGLRYMLGVGNLFNFQNRYRFVLPKRYAFRNFYGPALQKLPKRIAFRTVLEVKNDPQSTNSETVCVSELKISHLSVTELRVFSETVTV